MAITQRRGGKFQVNLKHTQMLGQRQVTRTFSTRAKAEVWEEDRRAELDRGFIHKDLLITRDPKDAAQISKTTMGRVMLDYLRAAPVSHCDQGYLSANMNLIGSTPLTEFSYKWCEKLVDRLKHECNLAPSTVKTRVGALKRCFDWAVNTEHYPELTNNFLRRLRHGYASMTEMDVKRIKGSGKTLKLSQARDRRLEKDEEASIRRALAGEIAKAGKRPPELEHQAALEFMFDLAIHSAMRLREMYTLNLDQIDLARRTIFLYKTKNGDDRQVPMSTKVVAAWNQYRAHVEAGTRRMEGFNFNEGRVFPFWDGKLSKNALRDASSRLSQRFGKIFKFADVVDFHFHDLRHEATSRLVETTDLVAVEIMTITGHRSFDMFKRYTNLRGNTLVHRVG